MAAVSRLLHHALHDRWGEGCGLVTLLDRNGPPASLDSSLVDRMRFGGEVALAQVLGRCGWTLYTHLSLARAQRFVPAPFGKPYAVFLHGVEAWRPFTDAEHRTLHHATLRLANSSFTATRVADMNPGLGTIVPVPLALAPPAEAVTFENVEAAVDTDGPLVIVVGRMAAGERYKGHDALLDAWPSVRSKVANARLVVVGEGNDADRLRRRAQAAGSGSSVVFTGFVSEGRLEALYRRASVFAMPSRGEGFGLVYLEAMAHALPCVGSIHDAASEIIEDGITGYLVDQADTAALADRIIHLLSDEPRRAEMGERGRQRLLAQFSPARFTARLLSVLDTAFGLGSPAGAEPRRSNG